MLRRGEIFDLFSNERMLGQGNDDDGHQHHCFRVSMYTIEEMELKVTFRVTSRLLALHGDKQLLMTMFLFRTCKKKSGTEI